MNRRQFTQMIGALFAAPALPATAVTATAAGPTPAAARFWAIYMTGLHGDVTPRALSQLTGLDLAQANSVRAELIAQEVIKPKGLITKMVQTTVDRQMKSDQLDSIKKAGQDFLEDVLESDPESQIDPENRSRPSEG